MAGGEGRGRDWARVVAMGLGEEGRLKAAQEVKSVRKRR